MTRFSRFAPGRSRFGRPGVFLALAFALAACEGAGIGGEDPPVLELGDETVQLEEGTALVDFRLAATGRNAGITPDTAGARPGDVVRFTAGDETTHAVAFDEAALSSEARAFLERTGQLRGPPLVDKGTSWVVSLEGAPPGEYPFVCLAHQTRGRLRVRPAEP